MVQSHKNFLLKCSTQIGHLRFLLPKKLLNSNGHFFSEMSEFTAMGSLLGGEKVELPSERDTTDLLVHSNSSALLPISGDALELEE